jgi:glutaredoxin
VRKGADLLVGVFAEPELADSAPAATEVRPSPAAPIPQRVEIAVLTGCPFSQRAQRLLRTLGIPHDVRVVRTAEDRAAIERRSGRSTLPQVFIDGQAIGGYDALADLHGGGALEPLRAP